MTALTAATTRAYELGDENDLELAAATRVFGGGAVGVNAAGYAKPLAAGDKFGGFALGSMDNLGGGNGEKRVKVRTNGEIRLPIAGITQTSFGQPVYASDDNTFTMTSTGNSKIGYVKRFAGAGFGIVQFFSAGHQRA